MTKCDLQEGNVAEAIDFISDQFEYSSYPETYYNQYYIESVNGMPIAQGYQIIMWYYYDEVCLPFDHRTPGLTGKLCVLVRENGNNIGGCHLRIFKDEASAAAARGVMESKGVEGYSQWAMEELTALSLACMYRTGVVAEQPINDYDECLTKAKMILGTA